MKTVARMLLLLSVVLLFAACSKKVEQSLAELKSTDAKVREAAIERLVRGGGRVAPKVAGALTAKNEAERKAAFAVMTRLGKAALLTMLDKIDLAFASREVREGFTDYFRSLGDAGYQHLLIELMGCAARETKLNESSGSMAELSKVHHHFESISLILETLNNNADVGRVPELLKHSYAPVRVRAAYLLCVKGWSPTSPELGVIYFSHLAETLECPNVPEPIEDAARLAASNFKLYLETANRYPAGGETREKILVSAGTEEVARYIFDQARRASSEFVIANLFGLLKKMESEEGRRYARELLRDPRLGPSIRAVDPEAAAGL